jgi:predicted porin
MNKKVLALAVAAVVFGAPVVASANATLGGQFVYQLQSMDSKAVTKHVGEIIVSGSEDLGNGLSGLFRVGVEVNKGTTAQSGQQFVGLRGGFGTVLLGRLDHPYRTAGNTFRIFGDSVGMENGTLPSETVNEVIDGVLLNGTVSQLVGSGAHQSLQREINEGAIAWVSNNMNGFTVSGAVVPLNVSGSNKLPYSLRAAYSAGPLFLTAAYEDLKDAGKDKAWLVGGTYTMGNLTAGLMYEDIKNVAVFGFKGTADGSPVDEKLTADAYRVLLPITYRMGAVTLRGSIMRSEFKAIDELESDKVTATDYAVGAQYSFSSRTNVRGTIATSGDNDKRNFGITVQHTF